MDLTTVTVASRCRLVTVGAHAREMTMFDLLKLVSRARRWCAFGLLLALIGLPNAAQAQSDWRVCAGEGQICRFSGEALVRFGADGRYAYRVATQEIRCDNDTFGDPAPREVKRCAFSYNLRQDGRQDERQRRWPPAAQDMPLPATGRWQVCATEGQLCRVTGTARVRYGTPGRYEERVASGSLMCSNDVFGDPAPGASKRCELLVGAAATRPDVGLPSQVLRGHLDWQHCAHEEQDCRFTGTTMVRYGVDGRWYYREASNGVRCGSPGFGSDPAPGYAKHCDLLVLRP